MEKNKKQTADARVLRLEAVLGGAGGGEGGGELTLKRERLAATLSLARSSSFSSSTGQTQRGYEITNYKLLLK